MKLKDFLEDEVIKKGGKSVISFFYQKGMPLKDINRILDQEKLTTKTAEIIAKVLEIAIDEVISGVREEKEEAEEELSILKDFKKYEEFEDKKTTYAAIRYLNEIVEKYKAKIDLDDPIIKKKIFTIIRQSIILTNLQKKEEKNGEGQYIKDIAGAAKTLQLAEEDLRWLPKQLEIDTGTDTFSAMGKKYLDTKGTGKKLRVEEEELLKKKKEVEK